jgi:glutathione S-transferase
MDAEFAPSSMPFSFGDAPTPADAALYGLCAMLASAQPSLLIQLSPELVAYARRLEAFRDALAPR